MNESFDIDFHLRMFAGSFISKSRADRWEDLLIRRPSRIFGKSSKIFDHLDFNYCKRSDIVFAIAEKGTSGVYYDFLSEPVIITFEKAVEMGDFRNAIFSIKPGKLAVFFFHEGWNYICKR
ncbi:MAG TPA: hypothetical protein PK624_12390 [Spirochaetota bacterium]|nr:hypothetical protein [Spirochaetota bacterium]HOR45582.1 hypothetical protein [Spirochaetota bacterium]HOU83419.1 hypothetical protein [Spirochaetota bacterium]HPK57263.1 hypothetical protein [Spirochaetota bacterium]HQE59242.1 hypothetical protein [Spirochaetota bacterium]